MAHIVYSLQHVDFSQRFIRLCNSYSDYDNRKNIVKSEIQELLKSWDIEFKLTASENCFYKDYKFGEIHFRFLVEYKHGFIDPKYNFWNDSLEIQILGAFQTYCEFVDPSFNEKVDYRFPISTSKEEAQTILSEIIKMHRAFLDALNTRIEN